MVGKSRQKGQLGIHQVEMRAPTSAGTEDEAFQLPNYLVPMIDALCARATGSTPDAG